MEPKLTFRIATEDDLNDIVSLLSDDPLGALRESRTAGVSENYRRAFDLIRQDAHQELTVAEIAGVVVGTFQLTFIPYLTHQGGLRAQIEAVRVASAYRGSGIGTKMIQYAINRAKARGCSMVQLTTDKQRSAAIRFYEALGFKATHEGLKLSL